MADSSSTAQYMLRRNLPLWKPEVTIRETIDFCRLAEIGEIIWKIDAEEFNHGFTPLEMVGEYVKWLNVAHKMQDEAGIVFSINPWLTMNHIGRRRYPEGPPEGFWWRVHPDGTVAPEMACPLSPGWRAWVVENYRLHSTTHPDKLWLEDDYKTFANNAYRLGCYCDGHIKAFSEHIGRPITREEVTERVTAPGPPDTLRGQWLDFQGSVLVAVCSEIEKAVHSESPHTRLGLMQSWSTDGRWWVEAVRTLAGPNKPLTRTSLASYEEGRALGFLPDSFDLFKETACVPADAENCPELENSLYTCYSKSTSMTRLQIALSQVVGNRGITMNLFDMIGTPIDEDKRIGRMLKSLKPVADTICTLSQSGGISRGVSVPYNKRYADYTHLTADDGFDGFAFDGDQWMAPLQGSGIPVFLNGESRVYAMTGQSVRSLTQKQILYMLSNGVLLDGRCADTLGEMGYAELIGVWTGERMDRGDLTISAERDDTLGDRAPDDPVYMTVRHTASPGLGYIYEMEPAAGAKTASVFVGINHEPVLQGMTLFENSLGGRVAVYPFDLSKGTTVGFMNWQRRTQLQNVVKWLGRERVDLFADGGAWMMPVRRDYSNYTLVAVLNFETDGWEDLRLTFEWAGDRAVFAVIGPDGNLRSVTPASMSKEGANLVAELPVSVAPLDFAVLRITQD